MLAVVENIKTTFSQRKSKILLLGLIIFIALAGVGMLLMTKAKAKPQTITANTVGPNTFTVSFFTAAKSPAELLVADNPDFKDAKVFSDVRDFAVDGTPLKPEPRVSHVIVARGLEPNKQYWYKVNTLFNKVYDKEVFTVKTPDVSDDVPAPIPVYGQVVDKKGDPLSNVLVSLQAIQANGISSSIVTTYTAENGSYSLDLANLRTDNYAEYFTASKDIPVKYRVTAYNQKESYFVEVYESTKLTPVKTFAFAGTDTDYTVSIPNKSVNSSSNKNLVNQLVNSVKANNASCDNKYDIYVSECCVEKFTKKASDGYCRNDEEWKVCNAEAQKRCNSSTNKNNSGGEKLPLEYSCSANNDQNVAACCTQVNYQASRDGGNGTCPNDKWGFCQDEVNKFIANKCGGGSNNAPANGNSNPQEQPFTPSGNPCEDIHGLFASELAKNGGNECLAGNVARATYGGKCKDHSTEQHNCGGASNPSPANKPQSTDHSQSKYCAGKTTQKHSSGDLFTCDGKNAVRCTDGHKWVEGACKTSSPSTEAKPPVSGCFTEIKKVGKETQFFCHSYTKSGNKKTITSISTSQATCGGVTNHSNDMDGKTCLAYNAGTTPPDVKTTPPEVKTTPQPTTAPVSNVASTIIANMDLTVLGDIPQGAYTYSEYKTINRTYSGHKRSVTVQSRKQNYTFEIFTLPNEPEMIIHMMLYDANNEPISDKTVIKTTKDSTNVSAIIYSKYKDPGVDISVPPTNNKIDTSACNQSTEGLACKNGGICRESGNRFSCTILKKNGETCAAASECESKKCEEVKDNSNGPYPMKCIVNNTVPAVMNPLTNILSNASSKEKDFKFTSGQQIEPGTYKSPSGTTMTFVTPTKINLYVDTNGNGKRDADEPIVTGTEYTFVKQTESFKYDLLNGWNAVNFPFFKDEGNSFTASEIRAIAATQGIDIVSIKRWEGKWLEYTVSSSDGTIYGQDFPIRPNEGYFIRATSRGTLNMFGVTPTKSIPMQFYNGWSLIGVAPGYGENMSKAYTRSEFKDGIQAFELLKVINSFDPEINADNVTKYDSGVYRGVTLSEGEDGKKIQFGLDYSINELEGYFVKSYKKTVFAP